MVFEWIYLENGRYGHALIRSDTNSQVYTMADTDTSRLLRALVSQPLISLDQAGRLENAAYMQWVAPSIPGLKMQTISEQSNQTDVAEP